MTTEGISLNRGQRGRSRKFRKQPVAAGEALRDLASRLGIEGKLSQYSVITSWEEVVGEQIARVAVPQRVDNGTLLVSVASAPWRAELSLRRQEILRKVNAHAGGEVIRDIRFR